VIKTAKEVEKMRRAGGIVREVLHAVRAMVKPGATTLDLEKVAETMIEEAGAKPAFKGYHGFPCVLCTSLNDQVVHGIPSAKTVLREGDILSIDGETGAVYLGPITAAAAADPYLEILRGWAAEMAA